jgi:hypothetical protein
MAKAPAFSNRGLSKPYLHSYGSRDRKCPQRIAGKRNQSIIPRIEGGARSCRTSSLFAPPAVRFLPVPGLETCPVYVESVRLSTCHVVSTTSHKTDTSFLTKKLKAWFPSSDVYRTFKPRTAHPGSAPNDRRPFTVPAHYCCCHNVVKDCRYCVCVSGSLPVGRILPHDLWIVALLGQGRTSRSSTGGLRSSQSRYDQNDRSCSLSS